MAQVWNIYKSTSMTTEDRDLEQISYDCSYRVYQIEGPMGVKDFEEYGALYESEFDDNGRLILAIFSLDDETFCDPATGICHPCQVTTRVEFDHILED